MCLYNTWGAGKAQDKQYSARKLNSSNIYKVEILIRVCKYIIMVQKCCLQWTRLHEEKEMHERSPELCKLLCGHHASAVKAIWFWCVISGFLSFLFFHTLAAECLPGKYGPNCSLDCSCQHNGTCDRFTGCCLCPAGFYGRSCEHGEYTHPTQPHHLSARRDKWGLRDVAVEQMGLLLAIVNINSVGSQRR